MPTSNDKNQFKGFSAEALTLAARKLVQKASNDWTRPLIPVTEGFNSDKSLADELVMWATNDGAWYRKWATPIIANLKKHAAKGSYDSKAALKSWARGANAAADMYAKEFGDSGSKGKDMFPPNVRKLATAAFENEYREEATE
jgi:hypothetical protein